MANDIDRAGDLTARETEIRVRQIQARAKRKLQSIGVCYYCNSPLTGERLFCDPDCAQDYEFEQKQRRLHG